MLYIASTSNTVCELYGQDVRAKINSTQEKYDISLFNKFDLQQDDLVVLNQFIN